MKEEHRSQRMGWLRAAVLGANDGILSTASLMLGVAFANRNPSEIVVAGVAGLFAGAMSMAAGEYVSVYSQADTESADLEIEKAELRANAAGERKELAEIYVKRGLEPELAQKVAAQLMAYDALGAHARDELGFTETAAAKPLQAALASAASFAVGAALPLVTAVLAPKSLLAPFVFGFSLVFLAMLGMLAAHVGGAPLAKGAARVTFWGALAMSVTAAAGRLFGAGV